MAYKAYYIKQIEQWHKLFSKYGPMICVMLETQTESSQNNEFTVTITQNFTECGKIWRNKSKVGL